MRLIRALRSSRNSKRKKNNRRCKAIWQYSREEIPRPEEIREERIISSLLRLWLNARSAVHISSRIMLARSAVPSAMRRRPHSRLKNRHKKQRSPDFLKPFPSWRWFFLLFLKFFLREILVKRSSCGRLVVESIRKWREVESDVHR